MKIQDVLDSGEDVELGSRSVFQVLNGIGALHAAIERPESLEDLKELLELLSKHYVEIQRRVSDGWKYAGSIGAK